MLSDPAPLHLADLDGCLKLSEEAGWNQNAADWRLILRQGAGIGIRRGKTLVASAAVMPYGMRFGWICMVLVTRAERRQGLASRLMRECMDWLRARNAIAGLDATPAGREVYRQLGFCDVYPLTRLERKATPLAARPVPEPGIAPLQERDLGALAPYDRIAFGEDRSELLAAWLQRVPHAAHRAGPGDRPTGFVLARDGRLATQIGPLVADDQETAVALLRAALARIDGAVFIDVPDHQGEVRTWLAKQGFSVQRGYTRMLLGQSAPLDRPASIMALAGPEFG